MSYMKEKFSFVVIFSMLFFLYTFMFAYFRCAGVRLGAKKREQLRISRNILVPLQFSFLFSFIIVIFEYFRCAGVTLGVKKCENLGNFLKPFHLLMISYHCFMF